MNTRNQVSTRFKDEIRIISPWFFFIAALVLVSMVVLMVAIGHGDHNAPPLALRVLLGVIGGTLLGCYVVLIGYVNRDAGRRGMSRGLWTLLAIIVPNALGIVLYFILRKPRTGNCPQCDAEVEPGFSFCPRCRHRLQPVCPHCQRSVGLGDKFCPYCGGALELEQAPGASSAATTSQP
jgi:Double zinc ribbon